MGKLDVTVLRYMGSDEFRMLAAVENGMKNHEFVPMQLLVQIAGLRRGGAHKILRDLVRHKLVGYNNKKAEGYRLTVAGYDFLALRAMARRESILSVGNQIGVGKESDIYIVANPDGDQLALKLHRLGRNSFRTIKKNRDYMANRRHCSWLYLAHLAAMKEYAYMKVLYDHGFPVPVPVDVNRNCIIMELLDATPLCNIRAIDQPNLVYHDLMELIVKLANHGLVHCDFNEFNLMISQEGKITLIDFPQMISTDHANAEYYFDRDVDCIKVFFARRFGYKSRAWPKFRHVVREHVLDKEVAASGFSRTNQSELEDFQSLEPAENSDTDSDEDDDDDDVNPDARVEVTEADKPDPETTPGNDTTSTTATTTTTTNEEKDGDDDLNNGDGEDDYNDDDDDDDVTDLTLGLEPLTVKAYTQVYVKPRAVITTPEYTIADTGPLSSTEKTNPTTTTTATTTNTTNTTNTQASTTEEGATMVATTAPTPTTVTTNDTDKDTVDTVDGDIVNNGDDGANGDDVIDGHDDEEDDDVAGDDVLASYKNDNKDHRAFRDAKPLVPTTLESRPVPGKKRGALTEDQIKARVSQSLARKTNKGKTRKEKGATARMPKAKKGKSAQRLYD
eukprot:m.85105 g.85105  ORF g.85105 m.85105 type:complete len:618 (-) comp25831_c0_seq1:203-2056(-)